MLRVYDTQACFSGHTRFSFFTSFRRRLPIAILMPFSLFADYCFHCYMLMRHAAIDA